MTSGMMVTHSFIREVFVGLYATSLMLLFFLFIGFYKAVYYIIAPLSIIYGGLIISLKRLLASNNMLVPHLKVRTLFYVHITIYILYCIIFNYFITIKEYMPYKHRELRFIGNADIVYSYYFTLIELLYYWTLYYHYKYISDKYKTPYVLYWPFYIICFTITACLYIFGVMGVVGASNHTMLVLIVMYKALYSFGWQLIMMYLCDCYIKHNESHNLRTLNLSIFTIFILIIIAALIVGGEINLYPPKLFLSHDFVTTKINEISILFCLLIVYKGIHSNKMIKLLSYISIIIGNIIAICYFMPFIDRMRADFYIICPSLLLDSVIISIMLYRFAMYLLKKHFIILVQGA